MNLTNNVIALACDSTTECMNKRQAPLTQAYRSGPEGAAGAMVVDYASTSSERVPAASPLYAEVRLTRHLPHSVPVGVHTAVGGECDFPTPGDLLCGALAACLDSTLRIIANKLGLVLRSLAVQVEGRVDVRGTLRVDKETPVAFQGFDVCVDIDAGDGDGKLVELLINAAEQSCIVLQTLRNPAACTLTTRVAGGLAPANTLEVRQQQPA
ncbi:OsmC family protein [Pseudomaricurvus sp. HS19]|uniref:OsmC family protein n=1 Tax=Pseudomaricurvus sp. HS19 TaxID=2692626 RepID=UPI00136E2F76|nr:OsmC family protein [Pseudomaricurvus sp. HS19]MYM63419.1 OsmC family peroxiredoxin [Pseudomaricurvus sp. HS19]